MSYLFNKFRKFPMLTKIILIAAVVLVLIGFIAFLWRPVMQLLGYPMGFDSPIEHYLYVEGKALDKLNDRVTSLYGRAIAFNEQTDFAAEGELHLSIGQEILQLLEEYLETEEDLAWLSKVSIYADLTTDAEINRSAFTLGLNGVPILSAEMILDTEEMSAWMILPDMIDDYIKIDLEDSKETIGESDKLKCLLNALPTEQQLNKMINKYTHIALSEVKQVESEDVSVSVGGLTQDCTALKAIIDQATLNRILIALLEEAKNDETLRDMVNTILSFKEDSITNDFENIWQESLGKAIAQSKAALEASISGNYILLVNYVDSNHNIIGRRISISENDDIYYLVVRDGMDFALEADLLGVFALNGSGSAENSFNAGFTLKSENEAIADISVTDFNITKLGRGLFDGTIRITPTEKIGNQFCGPGANTEAAIEIAMQAGTVQEDISVNLQVDNTLLVGVTAKILQKDPTKIEIPNSAADASNEEEISQWMSSLQYDPLFKNLKKAGVSQYLLDLFETMINAA